jgi:hypothetical protein
MAKIARNGSTGRFSVAANGKNSQSTIRDSGSGVVRDLKGYGALSGQYVVRKGVDLSKPIAAQASKPKASKGAGNARKSD